MFHHWHRRHPEGPKADVRLRRLFPVFIDIILSRYLSQSIVLISYASVLGATFGLSLLSDLLALCTMHLYAFYAMATAIFRFHTRAMGSLFNVFRGVCWSPTGLRAPW